MSVAAVLNLVRFQPMPHTVVVKVHDLRALLQKRALQLAAVSRILWFALAVQCL
jgi:hypothetical protein